MNRVWRRVGAWAGMAAVVFTQLAVSAYACPMDAPEPVAPAAVEAPCHQADPANANLCDKHCNDSQRSQEPAPAVSAAFVPAFVSFLRLPAPGPMPGSLGGPALFHATAPPPSIRNCCFRI